MADETLRNSKARRQSRQRKRLIEAFNKEEQSGLVLVLYARFIVLAILLLWATVSTRTEYTIVYAEILAAFAVLGALPLVLRYYGVSRLRWIAVLFAIDVILLTYILMVPGSMFPSTLTPQFNLQLPNFLYLSLFVVGMAISYSPLLVLWIGFVAIAAWSIGMVWILSLPDTLAFSFAELLDPSLFTDEERVRTTSSRLFVSLSIWYNRVLFLGLVSLIIAASVWRSRRLVIRQITSEAARTNLSRYFSPKMVDRLASGDSSLEDVDTRNIAVLFVDIVGFTKMAERLGPQGVIKLLRDFHNRMAGCVFDHSGTIDKYIGDALMANFGTPDTGPYDASNALRCAYAMVDEIENWNAERREQGSEPIEIGIGIHYGEVVTGNIGDEHHLEFAVLGDTVNLASRLERLTREVNSQIVVSAELVTQVKVENFDTDNLLKPLTEDQATTVRGRRQPVSIWRLVSSGDGISI